MNRTVSARLGTDSSRAIPFRLAFLLLWFADAVTAALFFVVPPGTELNPVTVLFYDVLGLPGVALAALAYATIVLAVGYVLPDPLDGLFMSLVVVAYTVFVWNNVIVLAVGNSPVLELLPV